MAFSQADADALKAAIATGAVRVDLPTVGTVTYRSLDEMQRALAMINNELNAAAGKIPIRRLKVFSVKDL
ncbi:MAG: hypothetical protein ISS15_05395 [Alphaproteobacteria bacterium]|nr:hypothetical protein [Alphaproteobacteria bacterium]MBL6939445.1 hypothetical protein [Alphaproteobacteria bacterium]MBL7097074.1 hypothetical protein [Alphaproteobacteria bacterium]